MMLQVFLLITALFGESPSFELIENETTTPILSPAFKDQKVAKIRLKNGLQAYLISNPHADQSAVTLSVHAGSWNDPADQPGVAHFLEHMLFLGTKKYPEEGGYNIHITKHGGQTNAFTESAYTTYVFSCNNSGLEEALDRFAEFFKTPLLSDSGTVRERDAVNSEFLGRSHNDSIRRMMIYREVANPEHPWHGFGCGNKTTLAAVTPEDLRKWHSTHYSGDKMTLVIYSSLAIETLETLVNEGFAEIPTHETPEMPPTVPMYDDSVRGKIVISEPINDERTLGILWEVPRDLTGDLATHTADLVGYVLGHEGKGSLLSVLKNEGYAETLSAGNSSIETGNELFIIEMTLTKKGTDNLEHVIKRVYQALSRLKREGLPRYIFEEVQKMARLNYQYPTRLSPFEEVIKHSRGLREEPLSTYPEQTLIPKKWDKSKIQNFIDSLTPNRAVVQLMAKVDAEMTLAEHWAGIPYTIQDVAPEVIKAWTETKPHPGITLPAPNPFVPRALDLENSTHQKTDPMPEEVINTPKGKVYFATDHIYLVPEISWTILIRSPEVDSRFARSVILGDLYVHSLKESFNEVGYQAKMAGLNYDIEQDTHGIKITIQGYSENAEDLLREILLAASELSVNSQKFQEYKDTLKRRYQNFTNETPFNRGKETLKEVVFPGYVTEKQKSNALIKVTHADFQEFADRIFQETHTTALLYGNMRTAEAQIVWRTLENVLKGSPYPSEEHLQRKAASFNYPGGPFFLEKHIQGKGNGMILTIQEPNFSFEHYAAQKLASNLLSDPFFSTLRTEQQTGYLVGNVQFELEGQLYTLFIIESHHYDPRDLLARTELCLEQTLKTLPDWEERFTYAKAAEANALNTHPENMKEQGRELAEMALLHNGDFQWKKKLLEATTTLNFEKFLDLVNQGFGRTNKNRLAILLYGQVQEGEMLNYTRARGVSWLNEQGE